MALSTGGSSEQTPTDSLSPKSWGQWAKESLAKGDPRKVIWAANMGRAIDVLDRNQTRAERIGDTVLGTQAEQGSKGDEGMGVHFGDIQHPQPVVVQSSSDSTLKTLATLALGGLLGGGGIAAGAVAMHLLNKPDTTQTIAPETEPGERLEIGLGRIEEYLGADR